MTALPSLEPGTLEAPASGEVQPEEKPVGSSTGSGRKLGRETLIYALAMLLGRAASIIMLPVYTRRLTPSDYGVLQILDMTSDVVAILVSAGCTAGVMRFYFKADVEKDRRAVLGSAMVLQVCLNLLGTLLLIAFANPVWRYVLHGAQTKDLVYLAAANFTLGSLSVVPLICMQIEKRALLYSTVSVVRLILQLSGNILFLVVFDWGPKGILLSSFLVAIVIGGWTSAWMIRRRGLIINRKAILDLRRFGLPYQLVTLGTFIVTFGDRLFLDKFSGLAAVGIYGLAYQFGFILDQLGIAPFMRAWTPRRFELSREPQAIRDHSNTQGFLYLNLLALTCAVGIAVFVHPVLRILAHAEYWPAADIVPIILAAYIVQGWAAVLEIGIDISEKTKYATYGVWASVIAVLVLYAALIPLFGGFGAAWATLLGFAVRVGFYWRFSQRLWPVAYGWSAVLRLTAYAAVASVAAIYFRPSSLVLEIAGDITCLAAYSLAVWTTVLHENDRGLIIDFAMRRTRAVAARFALA